MMQNCVSLSSGHDHIARRELEKDFSKEQVDALERAIIDVLQGETTYTRGECWEDGLRTTFLADRNTSRA